MGPFFQRRVASDNRLLICRNLVCNNLARSIERQAAIHMADDQSDSHQHHRSGDAAQNEPKKSQTRTIRHVDALMSSCRD